MSETHDVVDVIRTKRDGRLARRRQIDWVVDAYTRGVVADEQMSALAMAILLNGMDRREIARWTAAMIASGERMDFSALSRPTAGQALHRRGRRQDHAAAGAAGRGLRGGGAAAVRARARAHRRHAGQARGDPRLARLAGQRRDDAPARGRRCGDLRGRVGSRAGGQEAVRAAGRHRHGRVDPADRQLDHEQEDRRGHRRAGARRQGRVGRVHEGRATTPASSPRPWSRWARDAGVRTVALLTDMADTARADRGQRAGGARVGGGAGRGRARPTWSS